MLLKAARNQRLAQVIDNTRENNLKFGPRLAAGPAEQCEARRQPLQSQRLARTVTDRAEINSLESIGAISRSLIVLLQVLYLPALTISHIA